MSHIVLVTGATGAQGGATVSALLAKLGSSVIIHALVRDPTLSASQRLAQIPNVKLFEGDFDNAVSIKTAANSCTSAFLNVTPVFTDMEGEARHARNLIEACASTQTLSRIVFSSSGAMQRRDNDAVWTEYIPKNPDQWMTYYMKSKKACEEAVTGTSEKDFANGWTIIRGGTFLTNFLVPGSKFMYPELRSNQTITTALEANHLTSVLDPADVGKLAAEMLTCKVEEWNGRWKSKFVPLAKEHLTTTGTVEKMNAALKKASSEKKITLIQLAEDEAKQRVAQGDMVVGSQIFQNQYMANFDLKEIEGLGVDVGGMTSAEVFFDKESARLLEAVGAV